MTTLSSVVAAGTTGMLNEVANISLLTYNCFGAAGRGALLLAVVLAAFFFLAPFVLATVGQMMACFSSSSTTHTTTAGRTTTRSALCAGRVWHTRFLPVRHAFQYPLFLFCLDLEEVEHSGILSTREWWPLSLLVSFHESDHLKNGEGRRPDDDGSSVCLSKRLYRLVEERTKGKFQPTAETHRVFLITHLRYYGYNFNPVSFYILKEKDDDGRISAVVGEVSNTPWNEMHCYVLHPDSVDQVKVHVNNDTSEEQKSRQGKEKQAEKMQYVFPKQFHVSPFMEMHYDYEWFFWNFSTEEPRSEIRIVNNLRRQHSVPNELQFSAKMVVQRYSMNPYRVAWHVGIFPVYCAIIQLWIHFEAFRLFLKGVTFQPHPAGTETTASRWIGRLMQPFFAAQAWWESRRQGGKSDRPVLSDAKGKKA